MWGLRVWDYYTHEAMSEGPSYDWELVQGPRHEEPEKTDSSAPQTKRKIIWPSYHAPQRIQPDAITCLLEVRLCRYMNTIQKCHQHTL